MKTDKETSKEVFSASDFQYLWLYPVIMQMNFTLLFNGVVALIIMVAIHARMAYFIRQKKLAPMSNFLKYSIVAITVFGYILCVAGIIVHPMSGGVWYFEAYLPLLIFSSAANYSYRRIVGWSRSIDG
ncbi:MAG: hypothetical protein NTW01_11140 [Gammaproteobacteria bacterium]|nr:hypothetical protein [Gammaproteobacteria bacterium]